VPLFQTLIAARHCDTKYDGLFVVNDPSKSIISCQNDLKK